MSRATFNYLFCELRGKLERCIGAVDRTHLPILAPQECA